MAYTALKTEPFLWTTGFFKPNGQFESESDHQFWSQADDRADWLNGTNGDDAEIVYIRSEPGLFTVGVYDSDGTFHPESDHTDSEDAARRVAGRNSGR